MHVPHHESESLFVIGVTIFASIFDYFMGFRKCVKWFISCIPCYTCKLFYTMFILWSDGAGTTLKCFIPCLFYDLMALMRRWSACTTPGKWEFICSSDNDFSFYLRLFYGISEMFRKCGIFVFHFTVVFLLRFLIISLVHLHLQSFNRWSMTISYM